MAPLSKAAIVATALERIRRHGLESLTMRALADDLDVTATALYHHFENRDALLDAIVEESTAVLVAALPNEGDWSERLVQLLLTAADALAATPDLAVWIMTARARDTCVLTLHDAIYGLLFDAGFDAARATAIKGAAMRVFVGHLVLAAAPPGPPASRIPMRFTALRRAAAAPLGDAHAILERSLRAVVDDASTDVR